MRQGVKVAAGAAAIFALGAGANSWMNSSEGSEPSAGPPRSEPSSVPSPERPRTPNLDEFPLLDWSEASSHVGENARVCGPVAGNRITRENGDTVFINLGRDYPDPNRFTIVITRSQGKPARDSICARGQIVDYRGVPQIHLETEFGLVDDKGYDLDHACATFENFVNCSAEADPYLDEEYAEIERYESEMRTYCDAVSNDSDCADIG